MIWRRVIRPTVGRMLDVVAPALRHFTQRACRNQPQHYGIRLTSYKVPDKANEELIESRVISALRLLADNAPVHLRWLCRSYIVIFISALRGGGWIQPLPQVGILRFDPKLIWRSSETDLAMDLVSVATLARLRRSGFRDSGREQQRVYRRAVLEVLRLSDRLGLTGRQVEYWRQKLSQYPRRQAVATPNGANA